MANYCPSWCFPGRCAKIKYKFFSAGRHQHTEAGRPDVNPRMLLRVERPEHSNRRAESVAADPRLL